MDLSRDDQINRLRDLSFCLNNSDDLLIEAIANNLMSGHPAYWFRGRTSGATWVVELANCKDHNRSFLKALEVFVERKPTVDVLEILDNVIPLNEAAVHELSLCYRLQSTFRDDLADRERQAIFDPETFPHMDAAMMAVWETQYEAIQQRWANRREVEFEGRKTAALVIALSNIASDDAARAAVEGEPIEQVA